MMQPMDCTDIKVVLSGLLDDELDTQRRHAAERHVADCADCRRLVDEIESATLLVAADVEREVPARLPEGFEGAVLSRTVFDHSAPSRTIAGSVTNWFGWLAAAACLFLAITIWVMDRRPGAVLGPSGDEIAPPPHQPSARALYLPVGRSSIIEDAAVPGEAAVGAKNPTDRVEAIPASPEMPELAPVHVDHMVSGFIPSQMPRGPSRAESVAAGPQLSRADAEALYAAGLALARLASGETGSFARVEEVRRIAEYDRLLEGLNTAKRNLTPVDRGPVLAAESVLWRIVNGPVSLADLDDLRSTVREADLPDQLMKLSESVEPLLSL
jgi:anti-sigma factor RsiW